MAREINSTEVIIQPIVPKAVDDQQVIVYVPAANTESYGAIKLETDNLNPDVIAVNGVIQLRNGRVLQTKVDIKEVLGCVYATPNKIIPYDVGNAADTIVLRSSTGTFQANDAVEGYDVVNVRVLKSEINKAILEYETLNIQNGRGKGSLVQRTTDNVNDASELYTSAFGYGTKVSNSFGFAVGSWNEDLDDTHFEVGIGYNPGMGHPPTRRTGFAVYTDGRAMVYAAPEEDKDVVRKKELDKKLTMTTSAGSTRLYAIHESGNQTIITTSTTPDPWSVPFRDASGCTRVADAKLPEDAVNKRQLDTKYDKTGGTVSGNVIITGDLTVNGTQHINNTENLNVKNAMIYANSDGGDLSTLGGLGIKTNSSDVYGIVYDHMSDSVKLGLGKSNKDGVFSFNEQDGYSIATRADSTTFTNGHFAQWDESIHSFVDGGMKITHLTNVKIVDDTLIVEYVRPIRS